MRNHCIGITRKGTRCLKYQLNNQIFCSVHCRSVPLNVLWMDNIISYDNWARQNINLVPNFNDNWARHNINFVPNLQDLNQNQNRTVKSNNVDIIKMPIKIRQFKCYCCMTDEFENPESDLIGCSMIHKNDYCDHYICKDCFKRHIEIQLSSSIVNLKCVFNGQDNCNGEYDIEIVKSLISVEDVKKFEEYLDIQLINEFASICENYKICPLCKKYGCIVDEVNQWLYVKCGKCDKTWCSKCMEIEHGNNPCYMLTFNNDVKYDDIILKIDKMISNLASDTLTHSCVRCKNKYIKDEGCNLMTCEKCGSMSCYICGIELFKDATGNKYKHFKNQIGSTINSKCPLWNNIAGDNKINQGNTEFNIKKIMLVMDNFMLVNTDNKIRFEIYKRIYENFRKEIPKDIYKSEIMKLGVKYKFVDKDKLSNNDKRLLLMS